MLTWFVIVVGAGLLASFQLLIRSVKDQTTSFLWLAGLVLAMLVPVWNMATYHASVLGLELMRLPGLLGTLPWLYGPLLWVYVTQTSTGKTSHKNNAGHVFPFFLFFLMTVLADHQASQLQNTDVYFYVLISHISIYIGATLVFLMKRRGLFFDQHSTPIPTAFIGFSTLIFGFAAIMLFDFWVSANARLGNSVGIKLWDTLFLVEGIYISLIALISPVIRWQLAVEQPEIEPKDKKERVTPSVAKTVADDMVQRMEQQQLFKQPELNLPQLSESIGLSTHDISDVLNNQLRTSFYDFINQYRVNHACELLQSSNLSAIEIGFEAGFNSKSAFYNAFKKVTHTTPAQYRKQRVATS